MDSPVVFNQLACRRMENEQCRVVAPRGTQKFTAYWSDIHVHVGSTCIVECMHVYL